MSFITNLLSSIFFRRLDVMLDDGAYMPGHAHEVDAGYDLLSPISVSVPPHASAVIDTGVHMAIPRLWYGNIQSKSGLNVKHDITTTGTIDSGYTGSVRVKLYNDGGEAYEVCRGDKVAQIVFMRCGTPKLKVVGKLDDTERGDNGFGSTGR